MYLNVVGVGEEHGETIDAHPPASSWWQSIFQCCAECLINEHGFIVTLSFGLKKIQHKKILTGTKKRKKENTRGRKEEQFSLVCKPWLVARKAPSV